MDYVGWINAEGGPLLLMDMALAEYWEGCAGTDYLRACALFDENPLLEGMPISVGTGEGILWEMSGPGVAHVFRDDDTHYVIVRPWATDPSNSEAPLVMAEQPWTPETRIGELSSGSGELLIFWAAEEGRAAKTMSTAEPNQRRGETAIEDSGLLLRVVASRFRCFHDEVETFVGIGRRLHLKVV